MSQDNLPALLLPTTPPPNKPRRLFLTSHNTAIVPLMHGPRSSVNYFDRVKTWFDMVEEQPTQPVLIELDRNKPVLGAVDGCALSHLVDNAMETEPLLDLLAALSNKCKLVILFDFKSSANSFTKTIACVPEWRSLMNAKKIRYTERVKLSSNAENEVYAMDTLTNDACDKNKVELSLQHRKTYASGKLPLLSPLYAVWNCHSDSLAHDSWRLTNERDCLIRALHTTPNGKLMYHDTDYKRVVVNVSGPIGAQIAYLGWTGAVPERIVLKKTLTQEAVFQFKTAASFNVVAVSYKGAWLAYRLFAKEAVLEPIAAEHLAPIGYSAMLVHASGADTHVRFTNVS